MKIFRAKQMLGMDSELSQTPSLTPHMLLKAKLFWHIFIHYSKVNGTPTLTGRYADPKGRRLGRPS